MKLTKCFVFTFFCCNSRKLFNTVDKILTERFNEPVMLTTSCTVKFNVATSYRNVLTIKRREKKGKEYNSCQEENKILGPKLLLSVLR